MIQNTGKRITQLRKEKNLSMADLAKAAGVTRSLISQIEKGDAYPSLQTLDKMAAALGISMSKFFDAEYENLHEEHVVLRSGTRKMLMIQNSNIKQHLLSPNAHNNIEFTIWELPPYVEGDNINLFRHEGEEHFYVLEGELELHIGEKTYIIKKDDSGSFDPANPHYYLNNSFQNAKVITATSYTAYTSKGLGKNNVGAKANSTLPKNPQ